MGSPSIRTVDVVVTHEALASGVGYRPIASHTAFIEKRFLEGH